MNCAYTNTDGITQKPIKQFEVLGVGISATNLKNVSAVVGDLIKKKQKCYICVCPVSTIIECQSDRKYKSIVNEALIATPDGMPLVWIARKSGYSNVSRTYGPDLMKELCEIGQKEGYKHYFYGGSENTLELLEGKLKECFSNIRIVGKHSPPFREISGEELNNNIMAINQCEPDILWVGLGSPKQDLWMHKNRDKLNVPVIIGVGAAFDFIAGTKKQAPKWMQNIGLEWLFRLCCEPRRLWKRYLIGNAKFIYLVVREYIKNILFRKNTA